MDAVLWVRASASSSEGRGPELQASSVDFRVARQMYRGELGGSVAGWLRVGSRTEAY